MNRLDFIKNMALGFFAAQMPSPVLALASDKAPAEKDGGPTNPELEALLKPTEKDIEAWGADIWDKRNTYGTISSGGWQKADAKLNGTSFTIEADSKNHKKVSFEDLLRKGVDQVVITYSDIPDKKMVIPIDTIKYLQKSSYVSASNMDILDKMPARYLSTRTEENMYYSPKTDSVLCSAGMLSETTLRAARLPLSHELGHAATLQDMGLTAYLAMAETEPKKSESLADKQMLTVDLPDYATAIAIEMKEAIKHGTLEVECTDCLTPKERITAFIGYAKSDERLKKTARKTMEEELEGLSPTMEEKLHFDLSTEYKNAPAKDTRRGDTQGQPSNPLKPPLNNESLDVWVDNATSLPADFAAAAKKSLALT